MTHFTPPYVADHTIKPTETRSDVSYLCDRGD